MNFSFLLKCLSFSLACGMCMASTSFADDRWQGMSSVHPTGTVLFNPEKAYAGYTFFGSGQPRLVDMNGNLRHTWTGNGSPNKILPNGHILTQDSMWRGGQQDRITIQEKDFDDNVVWSYNGLEEVAASDGKGTLWVARQHHDVQRQGLPLYFTPEVNDSKGGNTIYLGHKNVYDKRVHPTEQLLEDIVVEVNKEGKIVWTWSPLDHLDQLGLSKAAFEALQAFPASDVPSMTRHSVDLKVTPGGGFDWCHLNTVAYLGENKWYDAGDKRFHPDNIIINSRELCLFAIIDKKSGDIVWKIGPNYSPEQVKEFKGHIIGAHSVHMIPKGLPGAGNILLFDNGGEAGFGAPSELSQTGSYQFRRHYSRVLEIDPVTMELVWYYDYYQANVNKNNHFTYYFFSPFVSNVQRLPNGNTFICLGDSKRLIEVTAEHEMVWEYISPYNDMLLYRSYRVPYDYVPQLKTPVDVAVTPVENKAFQLPNDKGVMPSVKEVLIQK